MEPHQNWPSSTGNSTPLHKIKLYLEYLLARSGFGLMGLLPYAFSLRVFGGLFARIGPWLRAHRRILDNLDHVGDVLGDCQRDELAREVWRNLGQTLVDLSQLDLLRRSPARLIIEGADILDKLKEGGRPILFFSAHLACWEMIRVATERHGHQPSMLYRQFNNPYVDDYARKVQSFTGAKVLTKGNAGARDLVRLMKAGKSALLLLDQRFAEGVEVDFLGQPAMTAPAIAALSLKYDAVIVPVHVTRLPAGHHKVVFSMPLSLKAGISNKCQIHHLLQQVNDRISAWIIDSPQQWFWLHRRWKA